MFSWNGDPGWDGKVKAPAVGWAHLVGLIEVLRHPLNTCCHTFLAKPQRYQRSERHRLT